MTGAESDEVARLAAEAGSSRRALFGARRRRRAAHRLAALRTPAAVRALAAAYAGSPDRTVVTIAADGLTGLDDQAEIDALCEVVLTTDSERLTHLVTSAGYRHSDPARRALLLFLTGRFEEYAELDFDGSALAAARTAADDSLRARLAERARESGRVEWVRAAVGTGRRDTAVKLSDAEWDAAIDILLAAGRPAQLWQLALQAPLSWSVRILYELHRYDWQPDAGPGRARYRELTTLARQCAGNPARGDDDALALPGRVGTVNRLVTTPDGRLLAAAGYGGVRLWHLPTGEPAGQLADGHWFNLVVLPDGNHLAGSRLRETALWRLPSGEKVGAVRTSQRAASSAVLLATSDEELLIASGGTVYRWRRPWGPTTDEVEADAVSHAVRSASDGRFCVAGGTRLPPCIESALSATGALRPVPSVQGTPLVPTGNDVTVFWLWRTSAPQSAGVLSGYTGSLAHLAVTADGTLLARGGSDRKIRLSRMPSDEPAGVLTGHKRRVTALAMSADGDTLASGDAGGTVRLWRLPSGEPAGVRNEHDRQVTEIVFTPDGGSLVSGDGRGSLWLRHLWHPELTALCRLPARDLHPGRLNTLRRKARSAPERPWVDVISALVRYGHRDDIEVADTGRIRGTTDIEVSDG
ncbi:hypothetical protein [Streptomyces synnematoformans]|uniref:WD40 repeat domain-containing protein n=1 Tax=Streptomyces synnematoformans TaxID=415721 RepID=A0ABP5IYA0_9ACTN